MDNIAKTCIRTKMKGIISKLSSSEKQKQSAEIHKIVCITKFELLILSAQLQMEEIFKLKAELRQYITDEIPKLSEAEKNEQSAIVFNKLMALDEFKTSQRISTYLSTDMEIDTEPIVRKIFENGKECFVPRYSKKEMQMVKLHSIEDWETLPKTPWNIKQPSLKDKRENALDTGGLDLIIVPGVAFTADGWRLGHGGGYYDAYLSKLKSNQTKPLKTVALAFKEQIVDDLPTSAHDVHIDKILFVDS